MKPVLVSATWCGPCKMLKSQLEQRNLTDKVEIKDVDVDHAFAKQHQIRSVPTLVVFQGDTALKYTGVNDIMSIIKELD